MQYLGYAFQFFPYLVGALLGLLLPLAVVWAVRTPVGGLVLVSVGYLLNLMFFNQSGIRLGLMLYLPDFTLGLLAIAAALRWLSQSAARPRHWALYFLIAIFAVNLVQGLVIYKAAAGSGARAQFYMLAACFYMATFAPNAAGFRALFNMLQWAAGMLVALACYRLVVVAFGIRDLLPPGGSFQPAGHSIWRVIVSSETLLMAQAALSLWVFTQLSPAWAAARALVPVLLIGVVGLQHRSVWLALLAAYAALRLSLPKRFSLGQQLLPLAALVVVLGMAVVVAGEAAEGSAGLGGDIARSTTDAVQLKGTAGERLGSWQQLIKTWVKAGPRDWAIGQPFGTSNERYVSDDLSARRIAYQPHNFYVELLVTQGLAGLACFLALAVSALRAAWAARLHAEHGAAARWLFVLLVFQFTYYTTYGVEYMQTLFLGAALALATALRAAPAKSAGMATATRSAAARPARVG